jgi:carbon-monoxide dehydrogenase catalytic subunit
MSQEDSRQRSADATVSELLKKAQDSSISTVFDRFEAMQPQCKFGQNGICCKICSMGPCRVPPAKEGQKRKRGVCGATDTTIAARNFARMVAGGTSAHSDHGRAVAETFLAAALGEIEGYSIKDSVKLLAVAERLGIPVSGRDLKDIAIDLGRQSLAQYGQQSGELGMISRAPKKRQDLWRHLGIVPRGVDREVVETLHRTTMGVDQDYEHLIRQTFRCALADGWGGSMLATELQDILFRTPVPLLGSVNLGILKEDEVNIIVHGHEPLLSEMIVEAATDPQQIARARSLGAQGITIGGICCTANEVLLRHGIPIAGNFLQQELAIITGAVEVMVVDVQCVMESLPEVARCFHTRVITTSEKARIRGAEHIPFDDHHAREVASRIVSLAIENYPRRGKTAIPKGESMSMVVGFSDETIHEMLGGHFRSSYRPLNDNIIHGRIQGVVGVVGCNNPRMPHDREHVALVKELIANDILVVQTGCSAIACGKAGLLLPEAASLAGPGLREVCEAVGMPPVLHAGSCVDNSRILIACTSMVEEGGLGTDFSDLPVAGAAPEWMSEKAVAIGQYFVASGLLVVFGGPSMVEGSEELHQHLTSGIEKEVGGKWSFQETSSGMATAIIDHIRGKRKALGIDTSKERVLYDMEMRRELQV